MPKMIKDIFHEKIYFKHTKITPSRYAWVILVVIYLAGIAAPLNQAKVPPIMTILMEAFQIDIAAVGSVTSVFAIMGVLLALPAGIVIGKLGHKVAGEIALGCLAAGSTVGAMSTNFEVLLVSRVVEGIGMGLLGVIAPAVISMWFPKEKQGVPMGIWSTWVPIGMLIMYLLAPILGTNFGWQAVWWFGSIYTVIIMIAFGIFISIPEGYQQPVVLSDIQELKVNSYDLSRGLANRDIWLLGFGFFVLVL